MRVMLDTNILLSAGLFHESIHPFSPSALNYFFLESFSLT